MAVQVTGERYAIVAPTLSLEDQTIFPEVADVFQVTYDHSPTREEYEAARITFDSLRYAPRNVDAERPELLVQRQEQRTRTWFGRFHFSSWYPVEYLPTPAEPTSQPQA